MGVTLFYTLNGKTPEACSDIRRWSDEYSRRLRTGSNHVGYDRVGNFAVSTLFTGVDMSARLDGGYTPPTLFETLVFCNDSRVFRRAYCTWDDAEKAHAEIRDCIAKHIEELNGKPSVVVEEILAELLM